MKLLKDIIILIQENSIKMKKDDQDKDYTIEDDADDDDEKNKRPLLSKKDNGEPKEKKIKYFSCIKICVKIKKIINI